MSALTVDQAMENIYESLRNDNDNLDAHIIDLKEALKAAGQKEAIVQPEKLVQNNRAGRKMMQSYFKKRGVSVTFAE